MTPELDKAGIASESITTSEENKDFVRMLVSEFDRVKLNFDPYNWEILLNWKEKVQKYKNPVYTFKVRNKEVIGLLVRQPGIGAIDLIESEINEIVGILIWIAAVFAHNIQCVRLCHTEVRSQR